MRKVFADTGYWIALLNPDDTLHQKARNLTISLKNVPIVTSEMIFTELLNSFSGKGTFYRQKAVNFINYSFNNPEIEADGGNGNAVSLPQNNRSRETALPYPDLDYSYKWQLISPDC